jgi:hypothetical protein
VQGACLAGSKNSKVDHYLEANGEEVVEENSWLMGTSLGCRAARARWARRREVD